MSKQKLKELMEAIFGLWDCCESKCKEYYTCEKITKLDDMSKKFFD